MNAQMLQYDDLIKELSGLCRSKHTGTMYIHTDNNLSANITLSNGKITFCSFRGKYNGDALPLLTNIERASYTFMENVSTLPRFISAAPLPDTASLLDLLVHRSAPNVTKNDTPTVHAVSPLLLKAAKTVEHELAHCIGPCAQIICSRYLNQHGHPKTFQDLTQMVDVLTMEIRSSEDAIRFRRNTLGNLLSAADEMPLN